MKGEFSALPINSQNFVEEIADILDFDRMRVKVVVKEKLSVWGKTVVGHYSIRTCTISINNAIATYWISTFATLLHEFRHHLQRPIIIVSMMICTVGALGVWLYGMVIHSYVLIYGSIGFAVLVVPLYLYFEFDAKRYERTNLPDVLLVLLAIEHIVIAKILGLNSTVRYNLGKLNEVIKNRTPFLVAR